MIVIICGLPGVGKSALSIHLAPLINAIILSSDKVRKELITRPTYSKGEIRLIYNLILSIAKYLHDAGLNCIIDATFNREKLRKEFRKKLEHPNAHVHIVECICPENIIIQRLKARKQGYSDADFSVYKRMKKNFQPIREAHITADTSQLPLKVVAKVIANQVLNIKKGS
ncbi:MAG: ATP-binding protein [Nitrososphaeraceae archaeon]